MVFTHGQTRFGVITSVIMAILVLSYTIVTGYLGQISLAQIAFAGAAGFLLSKLTSDWGIGFPLSLVVGAVFAALIGIVIGAASLRFSGAQFAIVTLAAMVAVQAFIFENSAFTPLQGDPIGQPRIFGINLSIESGHDVARLSFGILALVILLISVAVVLRWMRGRTGRMWLAVRDNERAAAAAGVNVTALKISAFAVSAFLSGVAGCLLGYSQGQFSANSFTVDTGILIFAVAFMGEITTIGGAVAAGLIAPLGVVYVLLNNHINFGEYYPLLVGLSLVLTIVLNPDGMAGKAGQLAALGATAIRRHRGASRRGASRSGPHVVPPPLSVAALPPAVPSQTDVTGEVVR
jgi:branched-chain amino acid transport system permease protein